jgi:hypothetical protein
MCTRPTQCKSPAVSTPYTRRQRHRNLLVSISMSPCGQLQWIGRSDRRGNRYPRVENIMVFRAKLCAQIVANLRSYGDWLRWPGLQWWWTEERDVPIHNCANAARGVLCFSRMQLCHFPGYLPTYLPRFLPFRDHELGVCSAHGLDLARSTGSANVHLTGENPVFQLVYSIPIPSITSRPRQR